MGNFGLGVDSRNQSFLSSFHHFVELFILILMSVCGISIVRRLFQRYQIIFMRAGFSGIDKNKKPEAQGVLCGVIFLSIMFLFIPVPFWSYIFENNYQTTSAFIQFLAGLLSICCMIFLGFADDALNLQWRHKLLFPSISSLPLLMVYLTNEGTTRIVVPIICRGIFGETVDIGIFYYIYMGSLAVFCTNSINIYAGINGLEVGQAIVITLSLILFNVIELIGSRWSVHLFSLYFLIPFLAVSWAMYEVNKFPAKFFVGDTYCYFAGMTFAVVGILGHFSKTLLLFFLPQILNFVYSMPQLFGLIPCPRHRLPNFNPSDELLYPSRVRFHPKSLSRFGQFLLNACTRLKLVENNVCEPYISTGNVIATPTTNGDMGTGSLSNPTQLPISSDESDDYNSGQYQLYRRLGSGSPKLNQPLEEVVEVANLTLINIMLRVCGPMPEYKATNRLLMFQALCSCLAFGVRYPLAWLFYEYRKN